MDDPDAEQNARLRAIEDRLTRLERFAGIPAYYSPAGIPAYSPPDGP
jgi:hypothetical protein